MNRQIYETILHKVHREGMDDLWNWLIQTDFFTAPASTKFHECYEGGLAEHSWKVYKQLLRLNGMYGGLYNHESLIIVALFHDICKVNTYKTEMRWRKNKNDKWEQYPTYKFDEDFKFGGHGSKSVYLLQNFIKLDPEEAVAINCHMGVENGRWEVNDAFRQCPLAFLLHTADMASTILDLNKEETQ